LIKKLCTLECFQHQRSDIFSTIIHSMLGICTLEFKVETVEDVVGK
jgi:hypothetical protein